jgi:hypothetical protein
VGSVSRASQRSLAFLLGCLLVVSVVAPYIAFAGVVSADTTVQPSTSIQMTQSTISQETVNGINVTTRNDNYGTWVLVMNYEHYGGTNPSVSPGSTFPKLPNNETTASDVDTWGSNGELTHVDNISQ